MKHLPMTIDINAMTAVRRNKSSSRHQSKEKMRKKREWWR
jgi:hypothetical protein